MCKKDLLGCFGRAQKIVDGRSEVFIKCLLCESSKAPRYKWDTIGDERNNQTAALRHIAENHADVWKPMLALWEQSQDNSSVELWEQLKELTHKHVLAQVERSKRQKVLNPNRIHRFRGEEEKLRRQFVLALTFLARGIPFANASDSNFQFMLSEFAGCRCDGTLDCSRCSNLRERTLPSRVDEIERCVMHFIRHELIGVSTVSCTVDAWSDIRGRKIIAVTAHWLKDWKMSSAVIGVDDLQGDANAANVQEHIRLIIDRLDIEGLTNFIVASLTSDNEAAMKRAVIDFLGEELDRVPCFAHLVALCLNDVLGVHPLLRRVRAAVARIRKSAAAKELRERCKFLEHDTLVAPSETRWSYEYYTISRFLEIATEVNAVMEEYTELEAFGTHDVQALQSWLPTLAEFERITRWSEGEAYVSISHIPHWILVLGDVFKYRYEAIQESVDFRSSLRESVRIRLMPLIEVQSCPVRAFAGYTHPSGVRVSYCVLAAALDPIYSKLKWLSREQKKLVWQRLKYEAQQFDSYVSNTSDSDSSDSEGDLRINLMDLTARKVQKQLKRFSKSTSDDGFPIDGLQFWEEHERMFPRFADVARMVFAVQATSAPAERVFSSAGFSDRRAQGASAHIAQHTFIRKNLNVLGKTPAERLESMMKFYLDSSV